MKKIYSCFVLIAILSAFDFAIRMSHPGVASAQAAIATDIGLQYTAGDRTTCVQNASLSAKFCYTGTAELWVSKAGASFTQLGAQGPQGIQGVKGDTGATGATGPQGLQGTSSTFTKFSCTSLTAPSSTIGIGGITLNNPLASGCAEQ